MAAGVDSDSRRRCSCRRRGTTNLSENEWSLSRTKHAVDSSAPMSRIRRSLPVIGVYQPLVCLSYKYPRLDSNQQPLASEASALSN